MDRHKRTKGDGLKVPDGYTVLTLGNRHYPAKVQLNKRGMLAISYVKDNEVVSYASKYAAKNFLVMRSLEDTGSKIPDITIGLAISLAPGEASQDEIKKVVNG